MTLRVVLFLLKTQFSSASLKESIGLGQSSKYRYLFLLLIALATVPFMSTIAMSASAITTASLKAGLRELPGTLIVSGSQLMCIFFGIPQMMSSLYFSKDLQRLRVLPLTPFQIIFGKLVTVYASMLLILALFYWPFAVVIGVRSAAQPTFWLSGAVVYLFSACIPLSISLLCIAALMRITENLPNKDTLRLVSSLLVFVAILLLQSANVNLGASAGDLDKLIRSLPKYQAVGALTAWFPPFRWASQALSISGFTGVAYALGFAVASSALLVAMAAAMSDMVLSVSTEAIPRRRAAAMPTSQIRPESATLALLRREHWNLVRTPAFMLTAIMNLMVLPLIVVIGKAAASAPGTPSLTALLSQLKGNPFAIPAIVGFSGLLTAMNQVPSTALSREGKSFWISRLIPVTPDIQIRAKLLYGMLYAGAQIAVLLATIGFFRALDVSSMITVAILSVALSLPLAQLGLIVDLLNPRLEWTHPQQAMKGNFNGLLAGLLGAVLIAVLGGIFWLSIAIGLQAHWALLAVLAAMAIVSGLLWPALRRMARDRYPQIEN